MRETIRCAIIGLGRIASSLEDDKLREKPASHAGAISANPETILIAACDKNPQARENFARRWGLSEEAVFESAEQMLQQKKPDILHITTHEDAHLSYLKLAVREGIPVVVVEKPLSDHLGLARRMSRKLKKTVVVVNHERRYSRDYRQVKEHISQKTYGELLSVSGRLYMGRTNPVKAILLHDGTHMLDIIPYLTGSPLTDLKIRSTEKDNKTLYTSARSGTVSVSCEFGNSRDHLVFELELSFSEGRIRVGNAVYEEWESRESTFYEKMRSLYPVKTKPIAKTAYFSGMMEDAVRVFRNPEYRPVSSYQDGLDSLILVQKLRRRC
ncbi:MAG: hypothetical protein B6241_12300 [Spirochaetaceae bacterium 4572_59]|nr:MAG: hypothetical protein B6241_12300 [Spirochaetaceae bacterium 4572_59]